MALFILTWNPDKWASDEWWDEQVDRWLKGEELETGWSTGSRKSGIDKGDLGILLRQGRDRGILALGRFTGDWTQDPHWDGQGNKIDFAVIQFHQVVDVEDRLPTERLLQEIPEVNWRYLMASGSQASSEGEEKILTLWNEHWQQVSGG